MKDWYKLKMMGESHARLTIFGDIGEDWWGEGNTGKRISSELAALDVTNITVELDSYGGSVSDGIHIYNALKRHAANIVVDVIGVAVSSASLIAMAADTLRMGSTTMLMIHAPWNYVAGNSKELREYADVLDSYAEAMSNAYAKKSGITKDESLLLLQDGADHWYTADEAVAAGFADEIYDSMPVAAHCGAFSRYKLPAAAAALIKPKQENTMTPEEKAAQERAAIQAKADKDAKAKVERDAKAKAKAREAEIKAEFKAAESERRDGINAAFAVVSNVKIDGLSDLQANCLNDLEMTETAARDLIMKKIGEGNEPLAGNSSVKVVEDAHDKFRAGATESVLARFGVKGINAKSNEFRGLTLVDLARESLEMSNVAHRGMDRREIVAQAFTHTTSDFPVILEDTMHKVLLDAYAIASDTWRGFCAVGSVSDFRDHKRIQLGSIGNLRDKNEAGEYEYGALPDGSAQSIAAQTKGLLIAITREMIINDDLGAFLGVARALGRSSGRTIEAAVYSLLASNPVMSDGKALFHADHGNLAAGADAAPISVTSLDVAGAAMASQKDLSDNDFLDIQPDILLVPRGMKGHANVTVNAQYDPDTSNKLQKPNAVQGIVSNIIATPRLTGAPWYMFADPNDAAALEVVFLNGEEDPYLDQETSFKSDGVTYKARHDFGVGAVDHVGAYLNPGA